MDLISSNGVSVSVSDELGEKLISEHGYKRRGGQAQPVPARPADPSSEKKQPRRTHKATPE